jgi:nitrate/nitrite transporter NarK
VTKFLAPFVLVAYGWQITAQVWAVGIALMGVIFWFTTMDDPVLRALHNVSPPTILQATEDELDSSTTSAAKAGAVPREDTDPLRKLS